MAGRQRAGAVVATALLCLAAGCSTAGPGSESPTAGSATDPAGPTALTYVAFGDSWPYGAHCGGCRPFPELYADALADDWSVDFLDLTTNGGTTTSLLAALQGSESFRGPVASADVIVISTGANDMEPFGQQWKREECGGPDNLDCFRDLAADWESRMDQILAIIEELRAGAPTAVRVVVTANEFSDPGLASFFGEDFAAGGGAMIAEWQADAYCSAAARHDMACVDLRPVLNGPTLVAPVDVNTQESMQLVADALVDSGLDELG